MGPIYLFCRTVEDINRAIETPDSYEVLRASALLRQLLIDGNRLVDIVNREARKKIQFEIADSWNTPYTKMVLEHGASFLAVLDGLSPERMILKAPLKRLNRDQFLSHRVVFTQGAFVTVRDIIDHCSNVIGGVHIGAPRTESQKQLSDLQGIEVGGASISIRQLLPILLVVRKALEPLSEDVCQ